MLLNEPTAYTLLPFTERALTTLLALGFQDVALPVATSNAAILLRVCPPILVKSPPAYKVLPETARERTNPLELGFQEVAFPVAVFKEAM